MRTADGHRFNGAALTVFVIEPSREMQRLLRAMLSNYGIRKVRMFSDSERAANAMLTDPPSVVLMDWEAGPYYGASFLKLFRHQNMYPVCLVPIIMMFSEARKHFVERALKLGAQAVVAKPMAPTVLVERINWVLEGHQTLKLEGERYVVDGVQERLDVERERQEQLEKARQYQATQFAEMKAIQSDVDKLLQTAF
jgi:DNA-binding response OmpR family regulator